MPGHFWGVWEKATPAKWMYLGVVYGYGLATRITLIYPEVEGWPLGISLGIPSHPPGLSTTMKKVVGPTQSYDAHVFPRQDQRFLVRVSSKGAD